MKGALIINELTDETGIEYKIVAGSVRYKACKKLNYKNITCNVYKNLGPLEEVYLDKLDNELDETHK